MGLEQLPSQIFYVKNCSLASIATGERASSLQELRDKIATVEEGCLYHHFWGDRMNTQFVHTQHHNDFASWVYHRLHDQILAEKLSIIDPTEFENLELLRQELLETIEQRLDNYEIVLWTRKEDQFHFVGSTIVVFDSSLEIKTPEELVKIIPQLSPNSIFYHFIDSRLRTAEKTDDFTLWLRQFGTKYEGLIEEIQVIDPYFLSLTQLKDELARIANEYFKEPHD
ncbi:MAG: DUF5752 family protein [Parachlamydiales bacterium]|jgi:hypothetical protein